MATIRTTTTVEKARIADVDFDLVAGCRTFCECPREAAWVFIYPGLASNTICEHHRQAFIDLMREVAKLKVDLLLFVRI